MSRSSLPPALTRFFAGAPLLPIGFRANGRPIYAIAGGAPDDDGPLERPDDVDEATWNDLGDPGKKALVAVRAEVSDLKSQLAAAKARPTPPKPPAGPTPPTPPTPPAPGDQPDIAKLVADGIAAAMKPFQEAEQQRTAEQAAGIVRKAVIDAAAELLHDGTDGLMVDLTTVVGEDGKPDATKISSALDALVKAKPHLAKDTRRFAAPGVGPTQGGATPPMKEQVQSVLAQMQAAAGVRVPKSD
jgi:hypothetical protein